MNEEGQVACRCGQCLTRRCYVRELALYRSLSPYLGLRLTATQSPVTSRIAVASCSPSASPMAVSAHPGPLSGPVERSTALHWSWNILLACSEPRNLVRQADALGASTDDRRDPITQNFTGSFRQRPWPGTTMGNI